MVHELTGLARAGSPMRVSSSPGLLGPRQRIEPRGRPTGRSSPWVGAGASRALHGGGLELLLRRDGPHGDVALRRSAMHVRVSASPAQPIQIDGDIHGTGWLDARVAPGRPDLAQSPGWASR